MIREQLKRWLRELADEPTVVICAASALLLISHYQGSAGYYREVFGDRFDKHPAGQVFNHFWWFSSSFVLYFVLPILISLVTRGSFTRGYGLGLGDWRAGLKISLLFMAVMVPAVWFASGLKSFQGMYPLAGQSAFTLNPQGAPPHVSGALFWLYELGYVGYFVGWEFFYRGWMINALLPRFGRAGALLIPIMPFAVMHMGKPELEALGSIVAGLALGILALRTRSCWYGVFLHASIAVFMDCLSVRSYF